MWKKLKTGSRVGIYWPDDECYYLCTVENQCHNPRSRFFVRYEDNVCEWINMATEQLMLLEDDYWYDLPNKFRIRRKFNDGQFYIAQVMYGMKWFFDNDKNKNVLTRQVKYTADDQEEWLDREQLNRWAYNDKKEKDIDDEDDNEEDVYGENAVDKTTTKQSKNAIGNAIVVNNDDNHATKERLNTGNRSSGDDDISSSTNHDNTCSHSRQVKTEEDNNENESNGIGKENDDNDDNDVDDDNNNPPPKKKTRIMEVLPSIVSSSLPNISHTNNNLDDKAEGNDEGDDKDRDEDEGGIEAEAEATMSKTTTTTTAKIKRIKTTTVIGKIIYAIRHFNNPGAKGSSRSSIIKYIKSEFNNYDNSNALKKAFKKGVSDQVLVQTGQSFRVADDPIIEDEHYIVDGKNIVRSGILYMQDPCYSGGLPARYNQYCEWAGICCMDSIDRRKHFVRGSVSHRSLHDAPTVARDVAERLSTALKDTITPGWFQSTPLVIVIVPITTTLTALQQQQPKTCQDNKLEKDLVMKSILFDALDLEHVIEWSMVDVENDEEEEVYDSEEEEQNMLEAAELEQCQWPTNGIPGFCHDQGAALPAPSIAAKAIGFHTKDPTKKDANLSKKDDDDDDDDEHKIKIRKTTMIMANELTDHFKLKFSLPIRVGPTLYGGKASDGNIVALLESHNYF